LAFAQIWSREARAWKRFARQVSLYPEDTSIFVKNILSRLIEVKLSDDRPTPALRFFLNMFPGISACQLVHNLRREQHAAGIDIVNASKWLSDLSA
jgi:hypothetical protein